HQWGGKPRVPVLIRQSSKTTGKPYFRKSLLFQYRSTGRVWTPPNFPAFDATTPARSSATLGSSVAANSRRTIFQRADIGSCLILDLPRPAVVDDHIIRARA